MENFQNDVKRYIKTHKDLHGKNWRYEDVARDLATSFEYDVWECLNEVEKQERQGPVLDFGSNQEEHF